MKQCPFCAEEIQDAAIKCRHCGSDLTTDRIDPTQDGPRTTPRLAFIILFVIVGGAALAYYFYQNAQQARLQAEVAQRAVQKAEGGRRQAEAEAERLRRQPRLLYSGTLTVSAGSFAPVPLSNSSSYETVYGSFKAAPDQVVTVLAFNETEFYKFKARESATGQQWRNSSGEFSFVPESDSYFIVVKHDNLLESAKVVLEVHGKPR